MKDNVQIGLSIDNYNERSKTYIVKKICKIKKKTILTGFNEKI